MQHYSSHLYHYALVNSEFQETRDIFSSLKPLIIPLLHNIQGQMYVPNNIAESVMKTYGIKMHPLVAEDFAEHLVEQNYLVKTPPKDRSGRILYQVSNFESQIDREKQIKFENIIVSILAMFSEKSQEFFHNAGINVPENIDYNKEFTKRLAYSGINGENVFEVKETNVIDLAFASTVTHIFESDQEKKTVLQRAYNGAVLSEVVLSIREPSTDLENIKGKKFYIDQPLLINILGFADEYLVDCSRQLIRAVQEYGGVVTTTAAYIDEAKNTIKYGLASYQSHYGQPSSLKRFLMLNPDKLSVVKAAQTNVEFLLEEKGFNLENSLINAGAKLTSQTSKELRSELHKQLDWYRKIDAMEHDAEAVLHVVSDYRYNSFRSFAESHSFLITNNDRLISDCNHVLRNKANFKDYEMSPILSEKKFAVLMWVLLGTSGSENDLSSMSLLTNCSNAMELNGQVIEKMQAFFKNLDPDSITLFERVVTNERLLHTLVEEVGGNADNLTLENFNTVVRRSQDKVRQKMESNNEALTKARVQISKQANEIVQGRHEKEIIFKKISDLEKENEIDKAHLKSANRRAKLAEKDKISLESEKADLIKETEEVKNKAKIEKQDYKSSMEKNMARFIEVCIKVILVLIFSISAYFFNGRYEGHYLVGIVLGTVTLMFTWVIPDVLFGKIIRFFSHNLAKHIMLKLSG